MIINNDTVTFDPTDLAALSETAQAAIQVQAGLRQTDVPGFLALVVNRSIQTNTRNYLVSQFLAAPLDTQIALAQQAGAAVLAIKNQIATPPA